ncbi:hypothetical protein [Streptomyces mirabilis]|uniref:hypothetical protein n=1 Tax=Streptomyces mirabilis TaxID=68239 RepID=UPI00225BF1D1|nr:hypothetical protein [Streptomyces mirabilis]MCX4430153.1 pyridoxamine 5'-phosphate oxidase family protein [Streptomyces mirabilis]
MAMASSVAFDVDDIDEAFSQVWRVLVVGGNCAVTGHDEARRLEAAARSRPWPLAPGPCG